MGSYQDYVADFEMKWRSYWTENDLYRVPNPGEPGFDPQQPCFFALDMFPYPSGKNLHVGHPLGYIGSDIYVRYLRMTGRQVLYTMGFDAFGLPAEQHAIATGQHPRINTDQNIDTMLAQLERLSLAHDPHRRIRTCDPAYYQWTQWIFLQIYNSFYDPACQWTGPDGRPVTGRARPIAELPPLLQSGQWVIGTDGRAIPAQNAQPAQNAKPPQPPTDEQIRQAVAASRLAVLADVNVNWCPQLGTVLSNEEVTRDGRSERGNFPVYQRPLRQWVLRITEYAQRLHDDLSLLDWPGHIVEQQRNWIGPSDGAIIHFTLAPDAGRAAGQRFSVFTTRPDTLFGATFMVLAPEHPLVAEITTPAQRAAVRDYAGQAARQDQQQRQNDAREKTGVWTGAHAINPATGQPIPVWIADYVLMGYGTGAIMAVPAHDARDFAFARRFRLPVRPVVAPPDHWLRSNIEAAAALKATADKRIIQHADGQPDRLSQLAAGVGQNVARRLEQLTREELLAIYTESCAELPEAFVEPATAFNSASDAFSLDGLPTDQARHHCAQALQQRGQGQATIQFRLRDWLFSRQRYWGEPFPIVYDEQTDTCHPVSHDCLPVELPEMTDFSPKATDDPHAPPEPPLGRAREWARVLGLPQPDGAVRTLPHDADPQQFPDARWYRRELNTMPNWAGSCWYYIRYADPHNPAALASPEAINAWLAKPAPEQGLLPGAVDLYIGGTEHAVLHLLYARFWHKVLYDLGHVPTPEPFQRLYNQGMITADAYCDARGVFIDVKKVAFRDDNTPYNTETEEPLERHTGKMGKRYLNAVDPIEICDQYSVDVFRLYEMYMGPLDQSKPWNMRDIIGMQRFCNTVWRLAEPQRINPDQPEPDAVLRLLHKTIARVTEAIDHLRLNTAIAAMIELANELSRQATSHPDTILTLVRLLAPFTPHLSEELFARLAPDRFAQIKTIQRDRWPRHDPALCIDQTIEIPVQVNGKLRARLTLPADADDQTIAHAAREHPDVQPHLAGKTERKVIIPRGKATVLCNFVVA